jgi:hypothetical protein
VIHVYFNKQGLYQHTQIKHRTNNPGETHTVELRCDIECENLIRENSQDASDFLQQLIYSNQQLHNLAMETANRHELRLREISQQVGKDSIQDYLRTANDFIEAIKQINRYHDNIYVDKRDLLVSQQVVYLKSKLEEKETPVEHEVEFSTESHQAFPPIKRKEKLNAIKKSEYNNILSLEKQLNSLTKKLQESPNDINLLIEKDELIAQIRLNLLITSSKLADLKPAQKKKLNTLSKNVKFDHDLLEVFQREFWEGNIEAVKLLYPRVENKINFSFLLDNIFLVLIETFPRNEEHESKLRMVLNFLYQESSTYHFLFANCQGLLFRCAGVDVRPSLLTLACSKKNLFAFKLLLEQGLNPNGIGLLIDNMEIPALFVIAEIELEEAKRQGYLEEALKFGAHYMCKPKPMRFDLNQTKHIAKLNSSSHETLRVLKNIDKATSNYKKSPYYNTNNFIDWCCKIGHFAAIELFLPQLKFEDLLFVFATLTTRSDINRRHIIPSKTVGCTILKNSQNVERIFFELLDYATGLYSILIYSKVLGSPIDLIEKIARQFQDKRQHLAASNPDALKKIFDELYKAAIDLKQAKPHSLKNVWQFDACLYLLVYEPKPTFMTYQTIMQLYCHHAACIKNNYAVNSSCYLTLYFLVKELAKKSCFATDLVTTKVYKYACDKDTSADSNDRVSVEKFFVHAHLSRP